MQNMVQFRSESVEELRVQVSVEGRSWLRRAGAAVLRALLDSNTSVSQAETWYTPATDRGPAHCQVTAYTDAWKDLYSALDAAAWVTLTCQRDFGVHSL